MDDSIALPHPVIIDANVERIKKKKKMPIHVTLGIPFLFSELNFNAVEFMSIISTIYSIPLCSTKLHTFSFPSSFFH